MLSILQFYSLNLDVHLLYLLILGRFCLPRSHSNWTQSILIFSNHLTSYFLPNRIQPNWHFHSNSRWWEFWVSPDISVICKFSSRSVFFKNLKCQTRNFFSNYRTTTHNKVPVASFCIIELISSCLVKGWQADFDKLGLN